MISPQGLGEQGGCKMQFDIRVPFAAWLGLNDKAFRDAALAWAAQRSEGLGLPWCAFVAGTVRNTAARLADLSDRDARLERFLSLPIADSVNETLANQTARLPVPVSQICVDVLPGWDRGGGVTVSPGSMIVVVRHGLTALASIRRNVGHEYSHTVRMVRRPQDERHGYGPASPYSVRDYLIFEGLATVLAEQCDPTIPADAVSADQEDRLWKNFDLDAQGFSAYARYMGMGAYEVGARVVRSYLVRHGIGIEEAHAIPDDELYWNSGYPRIR